MRGDLLGVDGVLLDQGAGVRLLVPGGFERALRVPDLHLQALAGAGLLGDRPEPLEGAGLLLDLERRRVPLRGQHVRRLPAHEAVELRGEDLDLGDVGLLRREERLRRVHVRQLEPGQLVRQLQLPLLELLLDLGSAAQAAVDLDVTELFLLREAHRGDPLVPAHDRQHEAADREGERDPEPARQR